MEDLTSSLETLSVPPPCMLMLGFPLLHFLVSESGPSMRGCRGDEQLTCLRWLGLGWLLGSGTLRQDSGGEMWGAISNLGELTHQKFMVPSNKA